MVLIILGVLVFGGLLAVTGIKKNGKSHTAASCGEADKVAPVIYLPTDIEKEKKKRNII